MTIEIITQQEEETLRQLKQLEGTKKGLLQYIKFTHILKKKITEHLAVSAGNERSNGPDGTQPTAQRTRNKKIRQKFNN